MNDKLRQCCNRVTMLRAASVALVVGSALNVINHYELLAGEPVTSKSIIKMGLTFLVPYLVSTHAQVWWDDEKGAAGDGR